MNELASETSPYLLQHAHQAVHWQAWNARTLIAAQRGDRPIMLSIGYAACHWCHVMAHESFDDPAIAELLNTHFVSIKVDREERPDIDQIYMTALIAMGQPGGWPLTMFLTANAEPFWGGTYFPSVAHWGRPSFACVLTSVAAAYEARDPSLWRNAELLKQAIGVSSATHRGRLPGPDLIAAATAKVLSATDPEQGGLRGAPKFPNFPLYRLLAQRGSRGDQAAAASVRQLLRAICRGGIFDHVGGGMFRYATDSIWLVPHFEKMLYDNAQLLEALAYSHADRPTPLFRAAAAATVTFLTTALNVSGVFAASLDADTVAGEGEYYVWTEREVDDVLAPASEVFKRAYDVTPHGNWEGRSLLRRVDSGATDPPASFVQELRALAERRATRPAPARDEKVLADWNGLTLRALCKAASVFGSPAWAEIARQSFDTLASRLVQGGRWHHAWRDGHVFAKAVIDDLAAVGQAALALFEVTGQESYLDRAKSVVAEADAWYGPAREGYAMTASDAADIPSRLRMRPRSATCSAVPSGSGAMAQLLAKLFHLTGDFTYRDRARHVIEAFADRYTQPIGYPTLLAAAEFLEDGVTVVVAGEPGLAATGALLAVALASPDPACSVLLLAPGRDLPPSHPAHAKTAPTGSALAYVCRGGTCLAPIAQATLLYNALRPPRG